MQSLLFFLVAALGEIFGCYAFWMWLRLGKGMIWLIPGVVALIIFAIALTQISATNAGRIYAAYGGIYLLSSLLWLWLVEGVRPERWDLIGVALGLSGTIVIMLIPRR